MIKGSGMPPSVGNRNNSRNTNTLNSHNVLTNFINLPPGATAEDLYQLISLGYTVSIDPDAFNEGSGTGRVLTANDFIYIYNATMFQFEVRVYHSSVMNNPAFPDNLLDKTPVKCAQLTPNYPSRYWPMDSLVQVVPYVRQVIGQTAGDPIPGRPIIVDCNNPGVWDLNVQKINGKLAGGSLVSTKQISYLADTMTINNRYRDVELSVVTSKNGQVLGEIFMDSEGGENTIALGSSYCYVIYSAHTAKVASLVTYGTISPGQALFLTDDNGTIVSTFVNTKQIFPTYTNIQILTASGEAGSNFK